MRRTVQFVVIATLAACAEQAHTVTPVATWEPFVPPPRDTGPVYEPHDAGPSRTWREDNPIVVHEDPARCQDPRIARVLDRCTRRADPPLRVWFTCPRSEFSYDDRRFAEIEMNGLWYDCGLTSAKPAVTPRECDGGAVLQAQIKRNRWDEPVQGRAMEYECQ